LNFKQKRSDLKTNSAVNVRPTNHARDSHIRNL